MANELDTEDNFYEMTLWPHRSFKVDNVKFLLGSISFGLILPILPFLGSIVGTFILMFSIFTLALFGSLFIKSYSAETIKEIVKISPREISITRFGANGEKKFWKANNYWVKVNLYPNGQIVENYLTLVGNNREVELGAYLSPNERVQVREKIENALVKARLQEKI